MDLSKLDDTSSLNHTKFANSPDIVQLIGRRLNEGDSFVDPQTEMSFEIFLPRHGLLPIRAEPEFWFSSRALPNAFPAFRTLCEISDQPIFSPVFQKDVRQKAGGIEQQNG